MILFPSSVHQLGLPAATFCAWATSACSDETCSLDWASNAILFFFLTIHESKSWKWRIEPLAASYQFKDSFLSPSSHNFSMLRLQCSLLGLELECLKPCRVSYDFTKQTPAGAQGEWMLRPDPMTSAFSFLRVFSLSSWADSPQKQDCWRRSAN